MSNNLIKDVLLVGASQMAVDYAGVLNALGKSIIVVGRGKQSAYEFNKHTGINVNLGGMEKYIVQNKILPNVAIVAVSVDTLLEVTLLLIKQGVKRILVEKPGGLNKIEIEKLAKVANEKPANVVVAYNRRFYASTLKAKEIIQDDGGVKSFNFEFTEWSHEIQNLKNIPKIKENWFLANSSHVIDLAFYLGGEPEEISCYIAGGLDWHPKASIYAGAGVSKTGALFSYQANWSAPGRWSVEVLTGKHRLIFRPMEKLHIQRIGNVSIEEVPIDDELDIKYKPGLYKQTKVFLTGNIDKLLTIKKQVENLKHYRKINGNYI